jgi:glucuronosyltransferase
MVNYFKVEPI